MDLNRAYLFIKIVEAGNITRAAELLNEPKAKLSRNLALLEEELGIQLVYRTTRQFKLTEPGRNFYQSTKSHLDAVMFASSELKEIDEQVSGHLKITAPDDIGIHVVTRIVNEFSSIYPNVTFELIYTNQILDLVKLGVDIAFRVGNLKDSSLIQKKVANIEFFLASSPKYLGRHKALTDIDELYEHETIGFTTTSPSLWKLTSKNKNKSLRLAHKISSNNFLVIRDLIKEGKGIGYLPKFLCLSQVSSGEIVHIMKSWGNEGSPLQIVVPHQKNIPGKVRAFIDFASKKCSEYF